MSRNYIESTGLEFVLRDDFLLDLKLPNGEIKTDLTAHRLFPMEKSDRYISFLDMNDNEVAILRDMTGLSPESRTALQTALRENYRIPKISDILSIDNKYGTVHITAQTDYGTCRFKVFNRSHNLRVFPNRKVILRDTDDNRYEIPDYAKLSRKCLDIFLF